MSNLTCLMHAQWLALIEQRTGMVLPESQHDFFMHKVLQGMKARGLDEQSYFDLLKNNALKWEHFVESIMIGETRFFRDAEAMAFVKTYFASLRHPIRAWSLACSTGEEAWSLAMLAAEASPNNFQVIGTDINQAALDVAKAGCYASSKMIHLPVDLRDQYWRQVGDTWSICGDVMANTSFFKLNLIGVSQFYFRQVDVIFCQNVLIYFRKFERQDVLNALVNSLAIGGVLILGLGEVTWTHPNMQKIQHKGILGYERIK